MNEIIVKMRNEGMSWVAIGREVNLHPITVADKYIAATEPKAGVRPTSHRIRKDRAAGMSWHRVAVRYDIPRAEAKRLAAA
jgi:hypothetical protein